MENRSHALAAGLFTVLLGAALAALAWWFTRTDDSRLVPYVVVTASGVAGLKVDAPVRYRGVEIGKVDSVRLARDQPGTIRIRILIDEDTPIGATTYAQLGYLGVTGLAFISLSDEGSETNPARAASGRVTSIPLRPSILDSGENLVAQVSGITERLTRLLDDDFNARLNRTLANVERVTGSAAALAVRLEPAARELPGLLADGRTALRDASGTLESARKTIAAVSTTLGRADGLIGNLDSLALRIDTRLDAVKTIVAGAEEVGGAARVLQSDTLPRINALADDLARETRALDRLVQTLSDQPHSVVFGPAALPPGPGEPGFSARRSDR